MAYDKPFVVLCLTGIFLAAAPCASAGDWPMWRYDAERTAASPDELPAELYLQWVLELAPPAPAWPATQTKLQFDASYEPVVTGKIIFVPSMVHDSVTAYDTETGDELWRFYTEGPVRLAPAAANGKVYFGSDDGGLYCVNAGSGELNWRFCGVPSDRKVLGNKRLISTWPLRGAPVLRDGTVYFAASIWPFMGIFIYALDAETGQVIWENTGDGPRWMSQPHIGAVAFGSVAPQGHFVATEDILLIPGGRTVPAAFDRQSGDYLHFNLDVYSWDRDHGGYAVAAMRDWFFSGPGHRTGNHPGMYRMSDGVPVEQTVVSVLTEDVVYEARWGKVRARDFTGPTPTFNELWGVTPSSSVSALFCKAGTRLYAGGPNHVIAVEDLGASGVERWNKTIVGTATSMLAADDKLFVVTEEGYLYCFGETDTGASLPSGAPPDIDWPPEDEWTLEAQAILSETGVDAGYCLVLGLGTGRLAEELVRHSDLCVIGLDPSVLTIDTLRRRWEGMYVPGERLSAFAGDVCTEELPPYLAGLIVSEDVAAAGSPEGQVFVERLFYSLRPYGGVACFPSSAQALFEAGAATGDLANAEVSTVGSHVLLTRVGALPGSADWTHFYADACNTVASKDTLVKAPLGLLWFGGSSNAPMLQRHGNGPSEEVAGGRLFIEGADILRAVDVYTGRVLWEKDLPDIGAPYSSPGYYPGSHHIGTNYASVADGVYVAYEEACLRLDPATGETLSSFVLPGTPTVSQVRVWDDLLVLAADPKIVSPDPIGQDNWNATCSTYLHVLDRYTGALEWSRTADKAFHHNTIIVGNDILFCIDRLPPGQEAALTRRGLTPADVGAEYTLLALDVRTGDEIWSTTEEVFGTWLGYSEEHDVLLQSGRPSMNMVWGEPLGRLITYDGADGTVRWDKSVSGIVDRGPYILHGDTLITQMELSGRGYDLLTGEAWMGTHPTTRESVRWMFSRTYGCGTAIASEHLLCFRSGAAGYFDLRRDGGTGNFGGFRSGCTANLIPANGVLNAPEYTYTCRCSYQNQTSVALVHMPEAEMWTFAAAGATSQPVKQVGINFGAPGDRLAENGVFWLDCPSVGYMSPDIYVQTVPAEPEYFRQHQSLFGDDSMNWIAASGAVGLMHATFGLQNAEETAYTIRLYFAEPEETEVGQRVFSVQLQGQEVLSDFDVVAAAGGRRRCVMREFPRVQVTQYLEVDLVAGGKSAPLLCGLEALVDTDGDGLCDLVEADLLTDPEDADTDGDGVSDYDEVWYDGDGAYNPYNADTNPTGTDLDAHNPDTDGDGINDSDELEGGTDPLSDLDPPPTPVAGLAGLIAAAFLAVTGAKRTARRQRTR